MPFRDDLDLSGLVDKFDAFKAKPVSADPNWIPPGEGDDPGRSGFGPVWCSTSRDVAENKRYFAWDPNRYYRSLGIPWPYVNASRGDLRRAYQALDGQSDEWLTHCLKMLVTVRDEYDAMPLGVLYHDKYVMWDLRRRAREEAERRNGGVFDEAIRDKVLDEWGYSMKRESPAIEEEIKSPPSSLDVPAAPELDGPASEAEVFFHYSYYLWKTKDPDPSRLIDWQAALVRASDGSVPQITVGAMGKNPSRFAVVEVEGRKAILLHENEEITDELANAAVTALMKQITN